MTGEGEMAMTELKDERTKTRIIEAATSLFYSQGYHGTSIRAIGERAAVNPSLISYYFEGKQGLLETLLSDFFEDLQSYVQEAYEQLHEQSATECLFQAVHAMFMYQHYAYSIARFVHREMTLDTVLAREVLTTYVRRETYYFHEILNRGMKTGEFKPQSLDLLLVQIRSMLTMPFLQPQYLKEIFYYKPEDPYFKDRYLTFVYQWIEQVILKDPPIYDEKVPEYEKEIQANRFNSE